VVRRHYILSVALVAGPGLCSRFILRGCEPGKRRGGIYLAIFFSPFEFVVATSTNANVGEREDTLGLSRVWVVGKRELVLVGGGVALFFLFRLGLRHVDGWWSR